MRKSIWLVLLVSAAVLAVAPAVALAALGVHDTTLGVAGTREGACAECHNTSATAATRGWGRATGGAPTTGWYTQAITSLCWTCHSAGNTVGAHDVTAGAMNNTNHAYLLSNAPPDVLNITTRDNVVITTTNLPYTTGASIQCTSCHNVHNNQYRPYIMKPDMITLCDTCHPGRNTTALRAANIGVAGDNVSVHPVNVSMTPVTATNSLKTVATMAAGLKNNNVAAPASNAWFLGGKLTTFSTGNVQCQTCHAVHGEQTAVGSAIVSGVNDLLAIDQASASAASQSSPLCEGCHNGGVGGGTGGTVGTGGGDHPLDNNAGRAFYPTGVAIPSEWTAASGRLDRPAAVFTTVAPATATNGIPRCSSCHDTHGGLGTKSLLRRPLPAAAGGDFCWACHTASQIVPTLHHSNQSTLAGSLVTCGNCHNGAATTAQTAAGWPAHNGFGNMAVGPDSNAAAPVAGASLNALYNTSANASTWEFLCERCHNPQNPTVGATGSPVSAGVTFTSLPARHGVSTGTQTHLTSQFTAPAVYIADADRTFNTFLRAGAAATNNWGTVSTNANAVYSGRNIKSLYANYGTGTPDNPTTILNGAYMICESCHNLLLNAGIPTSSTDLTAGYDANLLVMNYADDGQGSTFTVSAGHTSGSTVGDGLCRGCHAQAALTASELSTPTAGTNTYVHYPAAHTVRSAYYTYSPLAPYGRTTTTILTAWDNAACPNTSTADMSTASVPAGATTAPGVFTYPAANTLNCDSCHRPHNANQNATNGVAFAAATQATVEQYILEPGAYLTTTNTAKTQACAQCHNDQIMCGY